MLPGEEVVKEEGLEGSTPSEEEGGEETQTPAPGEKEGGEEKPVPYRAFKERLEEEKGKRQQLESQIVEMQTQLERFSKSQNQSFDDWVSKQSQKTGLDENEIRTMVEIVSEQNRGFAQVLLNQNANMAADLAIIKLSQRYPDISQFENELRQEISKINDPNIRSHPETAERIYKYLKGDRLLKQELEEKGVTRNKTIVSDSDEQIVPKVEEGVPSPKHREKAPTDFEKLEAERMGISVPAYRDIMEKRQKRLEERKKK